MSDIEQIVKDLAAIAAVKKLVADAEKTAKSALQDQLQRGTVYAFVDGNELGCANVPKPSQPKPVVQVVDEALAFGWMVDEFGEGSVETVVRLTEQGRKSLELAVLSEHAKAGSPSEFSHEGVTVTVPEPRPATPRFTPAKNVVELVQRMVQRGDLSIAGLLEIEARP